MIVIAVIAILAAVLIPNLSRLVEKANKSAAMQEAKAAMDNDLINANGDWENTYTIPESGKDVQYYIISETTSKKSSETEKVMMVVGGTASILGTTTDDSTENAKYYSVAACEGTYNKTTKTYTFTNDKYTCTFANGEWKVDPKTNS